MPTSARRNIYAQAVSLHTSFATGVWDIEGSVTTNKQARLGNIPETTKCMGDFVSQNSNWFTFFKNNNIKPLIICYEYYLKNQPGYIEKIAAFLGVSQDAFTTPPAETREISKDTRADNISKKMKIVITPDL